MSESSIGRLVCDRNHRQGISVISARRLLIVIKAMTASDDAEIAECLAMIRSSDAGKGLMHESYDKDDPSQFSRAWFAWANTLFGELVLSLLEEGKSGLMERSVQREFGKSESRNAFTMAKHRDVGERACFCAPFMVFYCHLPK